MRKKTSLTIVERAVIAVHGFEEVAKKLKQQVELYGKKKMKYKTTVFIPNRI